jgi:hypothetical protein
MVLYGSVRTYLDGAAERDSARIRQQPQRASHRNRADMHKRNSVTEKAPLRAIPIFPKVASFSAQPT